MNDTTAIKYMLIVQSIALGTIIGLIISRT